METLELRDDELWALQDALGALKGWSYVGTRIWPEDEPSEPTPLMRVLGKVAEACKHEQVRTDYGRAQ